MSQNRQLAAIMFTDIVGYTALMEQDEKKAFDALKLNLFIHQSAISEFRGKLIKQLGDGILVTFHTVSDALNAAIKIQKQSKEFNKFKLRIGIHQGEVVFEKGDVFGDAVNIASRIQSIGVAGSVIFTKTIKDEIKNKTEFQTVSLGDFELKNINEPIEVFALTNKGFPVPGSNRMKGKSKKNFQLRHILPALAIILLLGSVLIFKKNLLVKKGDVDISIAVLPFENMSNDSSQEVLSNGLSDDIIIKLGKINELNVFSRTTSFAFKDKSLDIRIIGKEFGVTHILEGSVQSSNDSLRIRAQLITIADGTHIWSDQWDRAEGDIFKIQDEISEAVIAALKLSLFADKKITNTKQENFEAWKLYSKGRHMAYQSDPRAIEAFREALKIDSLYAKALAGIAKHIIHAGSLTQQHSKRLEDAKTYAQRALDIDPNEPAAIGAMAVFNILYHYNYKDAKKEVLRGLQLAPTDEYLLLWLSHLNLWLGNTKEAERIALKMMLHDPTNPWTLVTYAKMLWAQRRFTEAEKEFETAYELTTKNGIIHLSLGLISLQKGNILEAQDHLVNYEPEDWPEYRIATSMTDWALGFKEKSDKTLKWAESEYSNIYPSLIAYCYAFRKDQDRAFQWMEQAIDLKDNSSFTSNPLFWTDFNHRDPRYKKVRRRLNLPE